MLKKIRPFKTNSMTFVIGVSVLLLLGAYVMPMKTSLGQGIDERVATGWQAVLNQQTNKEYYRMNYSDGSFLQFPISNVPQKLFTTKASDGDEATALDLRVVIQTAYAENRQSLERTLGTYRNAPSLFHPFSEVPVGFDTNFLKILSKESINPKSYGGPDIPPGSVPVSKLPSGILHIDTKADNNTLVQCSPGQEPLPLKALIT